VPGRDGPSERVAALVADNWDPEGSLARWRELLFQSGLAVPGWPTQFGGLGASPAEAGQIAEALREAGVPGSPETVAMSLIAPTLLEHGPDALRARHLRACATGAEVWCQLFSEPGAGSDLASLTTTAARDGDEWVVSGQKVWTTGAATADYGLLLARTDWDAPKHRGITCFALPMRAGGVEVRPLRQMNGHASFNEVFIDGARAGADAVIGEVNGGWAVALTTLAFERRLTRTRAPMSRREEGGRTWREAIAEATAASEPHKWYPQRAGRVDLLVAHAIGAGRSGDALVRQEVAGVVAMARAARLTAERAAAARAAGRPPGAEGSIGKLATSEIARAAAHAHGAIAGAGAMASGPDSPLRGVVAEILVSVPGQSIAGGTDEIQHNILAERVLGLPREPSGPSDLPFREVPRNL
jgi:alkylation response protein AidB-like acyl-CoA dehydrogenase